MSLLEEMMQSHPEQIDKKGTLELLSQGATVLLNNGQVAQFVELKRTNFIGMIDGKRYKIPVSAFENVIDKNTNLDDFDNIVEKKQPERQNDSDKQKLLSSLKKGDYFYINSGKRQNAELYIFEEIKGNKVIGINPITKTRIRIAMGFNYYKL